MRRMSGIWPPSKPMRMELPERAVWPLPPRPAVLPRPEDSPWPSRLRRCFEPGRGLRLCSRINYQSGSHSHGGLGSFKFLNFFSAAPVNLLAGTEAQQSTQGGLDHVGRVLGAE